MPPTASQKMPLDAVVEAEANDVANASANAHDEATAPVEPPPPPVMADAVELQWWMRTPEGLNYGPATDATVERWVREGRVTADCRLCTNQDPTWRAADSIFPALRPRVAVPAGASASVASSYPSHGASSAAPRTVSQVVSEANATSAAPPVSESTNVAAQLAPHRAPLVLTLGLVGFFVQCPIFSVMAWVMGSSDLDEMTRGRMDPAGASWTRVGRNLGLVLSIAWIIMAVILVGSFIFYVAVKA